MNVEKHTKKKLTLDWATEMEESGTGLGKSKQPKERTKKSEKLAWVYAEEPNKKGCYDLVRAPQIDRGRALRRQSTSHGCPQEANKSHPRHQRLLGWEAVRAGTCPNDRSATTAREGAGCKRGTSGPQNWSEVARRKQKRISVEGEDATYSYGTVLKTTDRVRNRCEETWMGVVAEHSCPAGAGNSSIDYST